MSGDTPKPVRTVSVSGCSSCSGFHESVQFEPSNDARFPWVAVCPKTGRDLYMSDDGKDFAL